MWLHFYLLDIWKIYLCLQFTFSNNLSALEMPKCILGSNACCGQLSSQLSLKSEKWRPECLA